MSQQETFSMPTPPHQNKNQPLDDLEKRIISSLEGQPNGVKVADITRMVGKKTKKEINPTMYKLERKGLVRKVNKTPPIWLLLKSGPGGGNLHVHSHYNPSQETRGNTRGRGKRGRGGRGSRSRGFHHDHYRQGNRGFQQGYGNRDFQMGYGDAQPFSHKGRGRGFNPYGEGFMGGPHVMDIGYIGMDIGTRTSGFRGGSTWPQDDMMSREQSSVSGSSTREDQEVEKTRPKEVGMDITMESESLKDDTKMTVEDREGMDSSTNDEQSGTSSSEDPLVQQMDYTEMWTEMTKSGPREAGPRKGELSLDLEGSEIDDMKNTEIRVKSEKFVADLPLTGERKSPEPMETFETHSSNESNPNSGSTFRGDAAFPAQPCSTGRSGHSHNEPSSHDPLQKLSGREILPGREESSNDTTSPYNNHSSSQDSAADTSGGLSIPKFPHQMLNTGDVSGGEVMVNSGFGRGQHQMQTGGGVGFGRGQPNSITPANTVPGIGRGLTSPTQDVPESVRINPGMGRGIGRLMQSKAPEIMANNLQPTFPSDGVGPAGQQLGDLEQKILATLSNGQIISTIDLARLLGGKKAISKDVNPTLYQMQRKGLLKKANDQPPKWCLSERTGSAQLAARGSDESMIPRPPNELFQPSMPMGTGFGGSTNTHLQGQVQAHRTSRPEGPVVPSIHQEGPVAPSIPQPPDVLLKGQTTAGYQSVPASNFQSQVNNSPQFQSSQVPLPTMSAPANDVAETMKMLNKNPISAFMEFGQSVQQQPTLEMIGQSGPSHRPKFTFIARVGKRTFPPVVTQNKKEGRREAAEAALRALAAEGAFQTGPSKTTQPGAGGTTFYDRIATLAHQTFNNLVVNIPECFSGKKVIAALILKTDNNDDGRVIALGTGNRCLTGDKLSLEGQAVHDSHAEVVTRRAFMGYLYRQLRIYHRNPRQTILTEGPSGKLTLKAGHTLHLYISTAPCGDGAQFSWTDNQGNQEGPSEALEFNGCAHHSPMIEKNIQGLLRTKMELGEGTIPIQEKNPIQTWDAILQNQQRLRTMSCSDKVCRWNILGLQGSLLSGFVEPIYLSSLTLGALYHHGHLARAVCCRLDHYLKTVGEAAGQLPHGYRINHPQLGHVTSPDPPRGTEKTKEFSVNWFAGCDKAEVTDGTVGRIQGVVPSRLCKMNLLKEYSSICALYGRPLPEDADTYNEIKRSNEDFQQAKDFMAKLFRKGKAGTWVHKPVEVGMFPP